MAINEVASFETQSTLYAQQLSIEMTGFMLDFWSNSIAIGGLISKTYASLFLVAPTFNR